MNISDEAVDAAVDALVASRLGDHKGINGEEFVEAARAALEAAAPYMQPVVTTPAELDELPLNSVVLDREGLPLHKDDSDRVEEWCYGDNAVDVVYLPAKVLHRG